MIAVALSVGDGVGLGLTALALVAGFLGWMLTRERRSAVAETKVESTVAAVADTTARMDKFHERDVERIERAIQQAESRTAQRLDMIDAEIVRLRERQHEMVNRMQTVAAHDTGIEQLDHRVALLERRSPPPISRTGTGGT